MERREVLFFGRVQGVGFRYQTRDLAAGFAICGFVRNQSDGSVQLVAEGEPAELDRFISRVAAELDRYIKSQTSTTGPATGEFADFSIRL